MLLVASDIGDTQPPKVVFGALWVPIANGGFLDFETRVKELRLKYKCWGKLQWKKSISSGPVFDFYKACLDLFVDSQAVTFSSIVVDQQILHNSGQHMGKNINAAKAKFVYLLLSRGSVRYCSKDDTIHVLLDKGEHSSAEILAIKQDIEHYYRVNRPNNGVDHIQQCNAHIMSSIQIADFIIGALNHRINATKSSQQHEDLTQHLEERLGQNLKYPTPQWQMKLNIWNWLPGTPFRS
jgi:hypothetical protein